MKLRFYCHDLFRTINLTFMYWNCTFTNSSLTNLMLMYLNSRSKMISVFLLIGILSSADFFSYKTNLCNLDRSDEQCITVKMFVVEIYFSVNNTSFWLLFVRRWPSTTKGTRTSRSGLVAALLSPQALSWLLLTVSGKVSYAPIYMVVRHNVDIVSAYAAYHTHIYIYVYIYIYSNLIQTIVNIATVVKMSAIN